jgi:hypothetical protein
MDLPEVEDSQSDQLVRKAICIGAYYGDFLTEKNYGEEFRLL